VRQLEVLLQRLLATCDAVRLDLCRSPVRQRVQSYKLLALRQRLFVVQSFLRRFDRSGLLSEVEEAQLRRTSQGLYVLSQLISRFSVGPRLDFLRNLLDLVAGELSQLLRPLDKDSSRASVRRSQPRRAS